MKRIPDIIIDQKIIYKGNIKDNPYLRYNPQNNKPKIKYHRSPL